MDTDRRLRMIETSREWRAKHASTLHQTVSCACGSTFTYSNRNHHLKTKRHLAIMALHDEIASLKKQLEELSSST